MKEKYFIGYLLPNHAALQAEEIATDLSKTFLLRNVYKKYPPHITLKTPFFATPLQAADLLDFTMTNFLVGRKSITSAVELSGFGHFNIGTIYWDLIDEHDSITTIQRELCDAFENNVEWMQFEKFEPNGIPHVTVATGDIRGRFKNIYEYLKKKYPEPIQIVLDTICLFKKNQNGVWEIVLAQTLTSK